MLNLELIYYYKEEISNAHIKYIQDHPELREIMADYLQLILHRKPLDVFAFTATWSNGKTP